MATPHYTTPFYGLDASAEPKLVAPLSKSANNFRRSISIFSRKGAETPEPTPPFLSQAAMRHPRILSPRYGSRMGRKNASDTSHLWKQDDAKAYRSPRGTVLHSVPPAKTLFKAPTEEEDILSSPIEEIVSAISEHAPTLQALNGSVSTLSLPNNQWKSQSTTCLAQRTKSAKRRDTNTRIGEWRDGIVHWDEQVLDTVERDETDDRIAGFAPVQPVRMGSKLGAQLIANNKPQLTVSIPGPPLPRRGERTVPSILQPKPQRHVPSTSGQDTLSECAPQQGCRSVSPIEQDHDLQLPIMKPPMPSRASDKHAASGSRSSTVSSDNSISEETGSSSRRSSATSLEEVDAMPPVNKNKALPALPTDEVPRPQYIPYRPSKSSSLSVASFASAPSKKMRLSRSFSELDACDRSFLKSSPSYMSTRGPSPTLSQAEEALNDHLLSIPEINAALVQDRTNSPLDVDHCASASDPGCESSTSAFPVELTPSRTPSPTPSRAPTIPKRSRKRDWRAPKKQTAPLIRLPTRRRSDSQLRATETAETDLALRKTTSVLHATRSTVQAPSFARPTRPNAFRADSRSSLADLISSESSSRHDYSDRAAKVAEEAYETTSAENILLNILSSLNSTQDLFNTAIISKGMYSMYKSREMDLIRQVAYNQSPAAWELREWHPREGVNERRCSSPLEYTPVSYLRSYRHDIAVIEHLKTLILNKCQTFVRRETAFALSTPTHPNASRFNDAFWRVWCFCTIFGSSKGREDDITGQLDWLKGGLLANNQGCVATVNTNLEFEMSSVLLNPPDYFAKANDRGLTAYQLFDMTELWTCMAVLLQGYEGRVDQAREFGVYDQIDVEEGDVEKEEQILEEWIHHLLSLGPRVILQMAELAADPSTTGFALAKRNGWTDWTLPVYGGSRTNFLKEPVAKLYEQQVAATKLSMQDPREAEKKEFSRQRVASLAAEIRVRRQSSAYKRSPYIDMKAERAMSVMSRRGSNASSRGSSRRSTSVPFTPLSTTSLWSSPPKRMSISPIMEERSESFGHLPNRSSSDDFTEDTVDRAVRTIVFMGFPPEKAREALRVTDMGNGLKIDRAVSWLLRNN